MNSSEVAINLIEFSKHLLVTIFAVFAFTSKSILDSTSSYVKVLFIMSLVSAIASLHYGSEGAVIRINHLIDSVEQNKINSTLTASKNKSSNIMDLPIKKVEMISRNIQRQFLCSKLALALLVSCVLVQFFG